jgi:uridine kinase
LKKILKYFLDDNYLISTNKDPYPLLNTYYNIEFLHEGVFNNELFNDNIQKLKNKYTKKIERFRNLSEYTGNVVFFKTCL